MADKQNKQIAYAVLKWLEKHKNTDEGLDVALQCISESFAVQLTPEDAKTYDVGVPLEDIFKDALAKNAETTSQDEKLQEFISILQTKGYFNGVEEGSPQWHERYEKAKQKFNARNNPYEGLTAEQLKTFGNQKMTAGQYREATNYYTKAIELEPTNHIFFANRAAAYTHLKEYKKAIDDCERSVALDANYSKAYSRLGTALFYEGSYARAVENYQRAVDLDPDNEGYKADLKAAEEKLKDIESGAASMGNPFDFGNMANILQNPEFMNMATSVMKNPEFAGIVNQIASNLSQGGAPGSTFPDFTQMVQGLGPIPEGSGTETLPNTVPTPFGNIQRDQLEQLQQMPEIKDNPKFQAIMEDVKANGPMAMLKYMGDPEVMNTMTKLAGNLFAAMRPPQGK